MNTKYHPIQIILQLIWYIWLFNWFEKEESADTTQKNDEKEKPTDILFMPQVENDDEVKEIKGIKLLTPNKILTRFPLLLAQIKAGNNSYKQKSKIT